jgi:peptidylprolyl isomerase
MGWIATEPAVDELSDPLVVAVRALAKPGDFSPVIETPTGFHILRLLETRPPSTRPYSEVAAEIRYSIQQEKRERSRLALQARLQEGLPIETNRTLLETLPMAQAPEKPSSPTL